MKENITVTRTQGTLQKIFRALNAYAFNGEINEPMITIQSTKGSYGHVTCGKVWKSERNGEIEYRHELNIGADTLSRPIENVCATMCHEMVHLQAMQRGIQDTSNHGVYHNKKFKELAENTGLITISQVPVYGWTVTEPTDKMLEFCMIYGFDDLKCTRGNFYIPPISPTGTATAKTTISPDTRPKSSTRKYICPVCLNSCRATKDINILCGDCNVRMVKTER